VKKANQPAAVGQDGLGIWGVFLQPASASFDFVIQSVVFSSIIDRTIQQALAHEMLRVLRPNGWLLWYDAARSGNRDEHFCDMPKASVEALFPGVCWEWHHLTTHLGLLKRVNMLFGSRGMQALDLFGICKTHLLGWGQKL
jgi:ubiquinone/menaquinone biosynthesis C-methylase UbiE